MNQNISEMECIQLTEPGRITVICQTRVSFDMDIQPLCLFEGLTINVPCKCRIFVKDKLRNQWSFIGDDINHTVIVPSQLPLISTLLPTEELIFRVERYDLIGRRVRQMLKIQLSKLNWLGATT